MTGLGEVEVHMISSWQTYRFELLSQQVHLTL